MGRIILVYGSISGLIAIGTIVIGMIVADGEHHSGSLWLGYLIMLIALSLIFVGVKRYRDRDLGGVIRFGTAFRLGLGIAAVAGVMYVVTWEIYLFATDYAFMDEYAATLIEQQRAAGASEAELTATISEMEKMQSYYANPLFRIGITFLEIFPVGVLMALIAAATLRNSKGANSA